MHKFLLVMFLLTPISALADETCVSIEDNERRLSCYDEIWISNNVDSPDPTQIFLELQELSEGVTDQIKLELSFDYNNGMCDFAYHSSKGSSPFFSEKVYILQLSRVDLTKSSVVGAQFEIGMFRGDNITYTQGNVERRLTVTPTSYTLSEGQVFNRFDPIYDRARRIPLAVIHPVDAAEINEKFNDLIQACAQN